MTGTPTSNAGRKPVLLRTAILTCLVLLVMVVSGLSGLTTTTTALAPPPHAGPSERTHAVSPSLPASPGSKVLASLEPRPALNITGGWLQLTGSVATTNPGGVYLQTMAYDQKDGYVLLFGGDVGGSYPTDTWEYQSAKWTQLNPTNSPPGMYGGSMAYDPAMNETVLFGGYNGATYYNQTWVFSGGQWTNLNLKHAPDARWRSNLAYDARDGYLLLFGGTDSGGAESDTWEFANGAWTQLSPSGSTPQGLYRTTMVYDGYDQEIILFGGTSSSGSSVATTYAYVNDSWKDISPSKSPLARVYAYIQYDPAESAVILYGGQTVSASNAYEDTWAFQNDTWTNISTSVGTPPPDEALAYMEYDPVGNYLLLYGGTNSPQTAYYDTTWIFGLSALVFASSNPGPTDVGVRTNISVEVLTGETALNYTYVGLPTGCSSANQSWVICKPTAAGTYLVQIYVNDTKGHSSLATTTLVVNTPPDVASIQFTPPSVTIGVRTHISAAVTGGSGIYTYTYPKLPPGCAGFNTSSLPCVPNKAGTFRVEANVTDQVGGVGSFTQNFTVVPAPTRARFASSLPDIDYGQTVLLYANVSGGTAPFAYAWSNLPTGCTAANLSPLPCKPAQLGYAQILVTVSDHFGVSVKGTVNLTVNQDLLLGTSGLTPLSTDIGSKISFYTNVTRGTTPYTYTFRGTPPGCSFTNQSVATCTPTGAGTFSVAAVVIDAAGFNVSTVNYTLVVAPDPTLPGLTLDPATIDLSQSTTIYANVTGGTPSYTFSYSGLPVGCSGALVQTFSCTPSSGGKFPIVVTAKDLAGKSATASATLYVNPTLKVSEMSVTPSTVAPGSSATITVTVQSGTGTSPYTYRYSGLPTGCSSSNASSITCVPTLTGAFTLHATVTDAAGLAAFAIGTLNVSKSSSSTGLFGLSPDVGYAIIVILIVVLVVALLFARGRSRGPRPAKAKEAKPSEETETTTPPSEEGEIYGSGEPPAS